MLLFPCNRVEGQTSKIGFTITNPDPSTNCSARFYLNGDLLQETVLEKFNSFFEANINDKKFKIKFEFFSYNIEIYKFFLSNMTWTNAKGSRRYPLCLFKNNGNGVIESMVDVFQIDKNVIELEFENFITDESNKFRINQIFINGKKYNICLPYVVLVQDYKKGLGVLTAPKTNNFAPYFYLKPKLKIIENFSKINHVNQFVKLGTIDSIMKYFEFVRSGYNISMMSYITIHAHDKYDKYKYIIDETTRK